MPGISGVLLISWSFLVENSCVCEVQAINYLAFRDLRFSRFSTVTLAQSTGYTKRGVQQIQPRDSADQQGAKAIGTSTIQGSFKFPTT